MVPNTRAAAALAAANAAAEAPGSSEAVDTSDTVQPGMAPPAGAALTTHQMLAILAEFKVSFLPDIRAAADAAVAAMLASSGLPPAGPAAAPITDPPAP